MVETFSVLNLNPIHLEMSENDKKIESKNVSEISTASISSSECELISPRGEELIRIQNELRATRNALAEKDKKMSQIQITVDEEVQELTEKLFQEAYKMVNSAEERREKAEKLLNEKRLEVEVLRAEVQALKELIAAPGMGRNHFIETTPSSDHKSALSKLFASSGSSFKKSINSSTKLYEKSGNLSISDNFRKKTSSLPSTSESSNIRLTESEDQEQKEADAVEEIDPIMFSEFESWKKCGYPMKCHPFIDRIQIEEIEPCMLFENQILADEIKKNIYLNRLQMEPVNELKPTIRFCELTKVARFCPYRIQTGDDDVIEWKFISLIARNRIAAVCDFYTCVRYLSQGLINPGLRDSYFHFVNLRKNMSLAKLGLGFVPRSNFRHNF